MIISVTDLKQFITTDVSDLVLEARLSALETSIRQKTHNNFQDRRFRTSGEVQDGIIIPDDVYLFDVGDTIMVNSDLCVIKSIGTSSIEVNESIPDNPCVLITKVVYPKDIVVGVVDVMSWMLANPSAKAGIASETLSRHSVSYQGIGEFDSDIGCPSRLLSFLNQYKKARF